MKRTLPTKQQFSSTYTTCRQSTVHENLNKNIQGQSNTYITHFKCIDLQNNKQRHSPQQTHGVFNVIFSECFNPIQQFSNMKPGLSIRYRSQQKRCKKGISLNKNLKRASSIPNKMKLSSDFAKKSKPSSINHNPYLKVQKTIKKQTNCFVFPTYNKDTNLMLNTKKKLSIDSYKPLTKQYYVDTERQTLKNRHPSIPTFSHIQSKTSICDNKLFNTNSTWNDEAFNTLTTNPNSKQEIKNREYSQNIFTFKKIPDLAQIYKNTNNQHFGSHSLASKYSPMLWKKKQKTKGIPLLNSLKETNIYLNQGESQYSNIQNQQPAISQQLKQKIDIGLQNIKKKLQMNDLFWPSGFLANSQNQRLNSNSDDVLNRIMRLNNFDSQQQFLQKKKQSMNDSNIQIQCQQDQKQNSESLSSIKLQQLKYRQVTNSQQLSEGQLACLLRLTHGESYTQINNQSQTEKNINKLHVTTKKLKNKFVSLDEYANTIITKWDGSQEKSELVDQSIIVYQCSKNLKNLLNEYQNKYRGSCEQKSQIRDARLLKTHQSIQEECQIQCQNQDPSLNKPRNQNSNMGTYTALNFSDSEKSLQNKMNIINGKLCFSKEEIEYRISQLQIN